jgi:site-specific recombinase XerC
MRLGNWLTADQGRKLLAVPASDSIRDKRDYAILSLLLGCDLRRAELTGLTLGHLQQRDEHWAIVNLYGKGGHIRKLPQEPPRETRPALQPQAERQPIWKIRGLRRQLSR